MDRKGQMQGMSLFIIGVILVIITGIVAISVMSVTVIDSYNSAYFGFRCLFSFVDYSVVNVFVAPASYIGYRIGILSSPLSDVSAVQTQNSCLQQGNIQASSTTELSQEIYTDASSCFSLFQGTNAGTGNSILSSPSINRGFVCYSGLIINKESGALTNYSSVISYIDSNYNSTTDPLRIVFITNGSNGNASYTEPSGAIQNGSSYVIEYFGYKIPSTPSSCSISFQDQCSIASKYMQPSVSPGECSYPNETVSQANDPVSSLTNGNTGLVVQNENQGCNYYVSICGRLINAMVYGQNRVFVCVTPP
jgi:hypothetical protein